MFEYKAVPAPVRAPRVKGLKTSAERFAHMLSAAINAEAHGGWQFLRSETLTCEERSALGRVRTSTQTVLIFAREVMHADTHALDEQAHYGYAAPDQHAPQPQDDYYPEEPAYAPAASAQTQGYADYDDHVEPAYAPEPPASPQPAPTPAPVAARPATRQEPLFRSSALLRGDGQRAEPVLRPRNDDAE